MDGRQTKSDGNSSHGLKARWAKKHNLRHEHTFRVVKISVVFFIFDYLYFDLYRIFFHTGLNIILKYFFY